MSQIRNFTDRALRTVTAQTQKQNKIIFGNRPKDLNAQRLVTKTKETNQNSIANSDLPEDGIQKEAKEQTKAKPSEGPSYIIKYDNKYLSMFKVVTGILCMPSVVANLYFIAFGFNTIGHVETVNYTFLTIEGLEAIFLIEIIINFFVSYKDIESYEEIFSIREIAFNFIRYGEFIPLVIPALPIYSIMTLVNHNVDKTTTGEDYFQQELVRDVLCLKLFRAYRVISGAFVPEQAIMQVLTQLYKNQTRQEKINKDRILLSTIKIFKQIMLAMIYAYFFGLLWYRFSLNWQAQIWPEDVKQNYFVYRWGLDSLSDPSAELHSSYEKIVILMYFSLTLLATVGYGDLYPTSIGEKMISVLVNIVGVTIFSSLMNNFIEIVLSFGIGNQGKDLEDKLFNWLKLIKQIRNQPFIGGKDISPELKDRIVQHFRYFWENDRAGVLLSNQEYFFSLSYNIREIILTKFLFSDILETPAYKPFLHVGNDFEKNFIYEVSFGFIPRRFEPTAWDRYIIEEEGDVTEIQFIMKGQWAIAFNLFVVPKDSVPQEKTEEQLRAQDPEDMIRNGHVIATKSKNLATIGDYYVLGSKRSQFHYVALTTVNTFALPQRFLFNVIFKKFPNLHQQMLSDAFFTYSKSIRRPCTKIREEEIKKLNDKMRYSSISPENLEGDKTKKIYEKLVKTQHYVRAEEIVGSMGDDEENFTQYKNKLVVIEQKMKLVHQKSQEIHEIARKSLTEFEDCLRVTEEQVLQELDKEQKLKVHVNEHKIQMKQFELSVFNK